MILRNSKKADGVKTDLAGAPRLGGYPFDSFIETLALVYAEY
jgi:hypothetical protein